MWKCIILQYNLMFIYSKIKIKAIYIHAKKNITYIHMKTKIKVTQPPHSFIILGRDVFRSQSHFEDKVSCKENVLSVIRFLPFWQKVQSQMCYQEFGQGKDDNSADLCVHSMLFFWKRWPLMFHLSYQN